MSSVADVNHNKGPAAAAGAAMAVAGDSSVTAVDVGGGPGGGGGGGGGSVPNGRHQVWTDNSEFSDSRGKLVSRDSWASQKFRDLERNGIPSRQAPLLLRQFLAEVLGTFLLVLFGDGSIAQYKMLDPDSKNFLSVCFGYGLALMIGILVSGNVSGGHLNPAVTLAMAVVKKCSWLQVPVYWLAQYLGALLGAAVLYGIYADGISDPAVALGKNVQGAGIFASFPNPSSSTATLIVDQALATACLLVIILAVTDKRNMDVPSGLIAPLIGLGLAAIHISFAYNAGCAINPARDLSPRLLTLIAGFGSEVFSHANYFFWIPWLVPHVGALIGAFTYYFMVEYHHPEA